MLLKYKKKLVLSELGAVTIPSHPEEEYGLVGNLVKLKCR